MVYLPLVVIFPALWVISPLRWVGGISALIYYLSASKDLIMGASHYYDISFLSGALIWVGVGIIQMLPYLILWCPGKNRRVFRVPLLILVLAIPPFGIVGWANPLTASGVIFPHFGWLGLVFTLGLMMAISRWPIVSVIPITLCVALIFHTDLPVPTLPLGWKGIDTQYPFKFGHQFYIEDYYRHLDMIQTCKRSDETVLVFPESVGGKWNSSTQQLWETYYPNSDKTILVGAVNTFHNRQENVIIQISGKSSHIIYKQRVPIPLNMLNIDSELSLSANGFRNPVVQVRNQLIAPLICYEQFLMWTILHSQLYGADTILAIGNLSWAKDTHIPAIQKMIVTSWAMLFDTDLVMAVNQ
ncbi:MAG: hypothetical protein HRT90_06515 [Candidatus Margulisbacteria bacterium]|nr:hypothetical protein [Candidatus Margulisiibacteriota bacterium]